MHARFRPHRPHPPLDADDLAYVRHAFRTLEAIAAAEDVPEATMEAWVVRGLLPQPAYVLGDGTPLFAPDLLGLVHAAGGVDAVPGHFAARVAGAALATGDAGADRPAREWSTWQTGEYAICLRQPGPETLVLKEWWVARVDAWLAAPRPEDPTWRASLGRGVSALDALLRPFARADSVRFGRPTSRERCVDGPRTRWAWLAAEPPPGPP